MVAEGELLLYRKQWKEDVHHTAHYWAKVYQVNAGYVGELHAF